MASGYSDSDVAMFITALGPDTGIEVIDPVERRRRTLRTPEPVSPTTVDSDRFQFPVETAVEIETAAISLPVKEHVCLRDADGRMIEEVDSYRELPEGTYSIEPTGIVKLYLRVTSAVTVRPDGDSMTIEFGEPTSVLVGSWSQHDRPATTVTITPDPEDVLRAISTFGSALTTTSPERAFPSYRGHPPAVEVGAERSIPDGLEVPEDDLHIEVPAEYRYAYPVAPLAYYLGVPVEPGPVPRLVGPGIDHRLEDGGSFEDGIRTTLERIFLLDCVTRTEGIYRVDLHERSVLEERVDLPFERLYDAPQCERLHRYLEVPFDRLADLVPDWQHAAHVEPTSDSAEMLPYLVEDLAIVHTADPDPVPGEAIENGATQRLTRGATASADSSFVHPTQPTDAIDETWVGTGTPIGATEAMTAAYRNRIGRKPSVEDIGITVVCNAEAMTDERDDVDDVYGSRRDLPFDVTVQRDTTTEELAGLLTDHRELLHYIGHIDERGFQCTDGYLDVRSVEHVAVDAFFLNACQSYDQGQALIRAGAIGGIVTLSDVVNYGAVRIGRAVARLLNCGFPLRTALELARDESVIGSQYVVVGDGGFSLVQPDSGIPHINRVENRADGFGLTIDLYGAQSGMGGLFITHLEHCDQYFLASGSTTELSVTGSELVDFLERGDSPIVLDGELTWKSDLDLSSLVGG